MQLAYCTLDVFTAEPLTGNQLAVVDVPAGSPLHSNQQLMKRICREFNYSETTFLSAAAVSTPPPDARSEHGEWDFHIFMPTKGGQELPFAGHPTVGTAWILAQRYPALQTATLNALAGPIDITYSREADVITASASIPHNVHRHSKDVAAEAIITTQPQLRGKLMWPTQPVVSIVKGMTFILVQLNSRARLSEVTTTAGSVVADYDSGWTPTFGCPYYFFIERESAAAITVHTRMIEGALEDAATGSAASTLASHLSSLQWASGRKAKVTRYHMRQGEDMGRPSSILVTTTQDDAGKLQKVELSGTCVQVMEGQMHC